METIAVSDVGSTQDNWQVTPYRCTEFGPRQSRYCICVPVINEGTKIIQQLERMQALRLGADIILTDGGSTDGSTEPERLRGLGVRTLLVKTGPGKLSAQMRIFFAYALEQGYDGVVTIDGNGKDGVEAIPSFLQALADGFGFVQGSRYVPGGKEENTPLDRKLGLKFVHAPLISIAAGFRYTDTTNGFRAFSREFLLDPAVQPFRDVFDTYNLHYYLSIRAPRLKYRVKELPVTRCYPKSGPTPSKISGLSGKFAIIQLLWYAVIGRYNPQP
ncbi:MAG TPA: glycosyltransferase family 2 protein [Bryobacteraceae bacterium]|nr:glycosyltransferase family 2 protein [Bryobacteraceae bacterium]